MKIYSLMSCRGWEDSGFMGPCSIAWLLFALLVFVVLISRRQIDEFFDMEYNLILGFAGALVPYLLIVTLTGAMKWAFLAGLIGSLVLGIFGGSLFGGAGAGEFE